MPNTNKLLILGILGFAGVGAYFFLKDKDLIGIAKQGNQTQMLSGDVPSNLYVPQFEQSQNAQAQQNSDLVVATSKGSITNPYLPNESVPAVSGQTNYFENSDGTIGSVTTTSIPAKTITQPTSSSPKNSSDQTSSSSGSKISNAIKSVIQNIPIVKATSSIIKSTSKIKQLFKK